MNVQAQTLQVLCLSLQVVKLRHRLQLKLGHRTQLKLSHRLHSSSATSASSSSNTSATGRCSFLLVRQPPLDSLHDEDRLSMDFTESEASITGCSELLDWAATFCRLERSDAEDQNKVLGMQNPVYRAPTRAAINLSLPWHSSAVEIVDRNFNIVTGKSLNPAKSWGPKDFFSGIGYHIIT